MTGRFKMKIAIKLSKNLGFLPVLQSCRHFTIVVSRFHSLCPSLCPYPLPLPSKSASKQQPEGSFLEVEFAPVTRLLKKPLVASQPKSVTCSQGLPSLLSLCLWPCSSSVSAVPGTLDSQFLKCSGAHVHPTPCREGLSRFLLPDTRSPSFLISEQASVPQGRLPLTTLTDPVPFH